MFSIKDYIMLAAGIALISSFGIYTYHERSIGAQKATQKIVAASQAQGTRANEKSMEVRKRSATPGALDRLRADPAACPSCSGKAVQ